MFPDILKGSRSPPKEWIVWSPERGKNKGRKGVLEGRKTERAYIIYIFFLSDDSLPPISTTDPRSARAFLFVYRLPSRTRSSLRTRSRLRSTVSAALAVTLSDAGRRADRIARSKSSASTNPVAPSQPRTCSSTIPSWVRSSLTSRLSTTRPSLSMATSSTSSRRETR